MRIILVTQDDPFYLAQNLDYLIRIFPAHSQIVGCVLSDVSPFGKQESFVKKTLKTFRIFGLRFFLYYSVYYLLCKFNPKKQVRSVLNKNGIDIINLNQSINTDDSVKKIQSFQPDLLISILGNQIFQTKIIELAPKGCLNLHTALLPKYRGLMPAFWVLKNNEKHTGVSVFYVDSGIDSGPIIVQKKITIPFKMTHRQLIKQTKRIGMEAVAEAVDLIERNAVELIKNDSSQKTYYSFPEKADVKGFLKKGKRFF